MSSRHASWSWGEWISTRGRVVGFRRHIDLAAAVGCTVHRLSRWLQMKAPPPSMRKGFDRALARALQTSRRTLFTEYVDTDPAAAPLVIEEPREPAELRREIKAAADQLDGERLRLLYVTGHALLGAAEPQVA